MGQILGVLRFFSPVAVSARMAVAEGGSAPPAGTLVRVQTLLRWVRHLEANSFCADFDLLRRLYEYRLIL